MVSRTSNEDVFPTAESFRAEGYLMNSERFAMETPNISILDFRAVGNPANAIWGCFTKSEAYNEHPGIL